MSREDPLSPTKTPLERIKSGEHDPFQHDLPSIYRLNPNDTLERQGLLAEDTRRKFHSTLCLEAATDQQKRPSTDFNNHLLADRALLSKSMEIDENSLNLQNRNSGDVKTMLQKLQHTSRESVNKMQRYLNRNRHRPKHARPSSSRKSSTASFTNNTLAGGNYLNPERRLSESSSSSHTLEGFAPTNTPLSQIPVSPFPDNLPSKKVPDRQNLQSRPRLPTFVNSDFNSLPPSKPTNLAPPPMCNGTQAFNALLPSVNNPTFQRNPSLNGPSGLHPSGDTDDGELGALGRPPDNPMVGAIAGNKANNVGKNRQRPSLPKPPQLLSDSNHQFKDLLEIHGMNAFSFAFCSVKKCFFFEFRFPLLLAVRDGRKKRPSHKLICALSLPHCSSAQPSPAQRQFLQSHPIFILNHLNQNSFCVSRAINCHCIKYMFESLKTFSLS